MEEMIISDL